MRKKMMIGSLLPAQKLHQWQRLIVVLVVAGLFFTLRADSQRLEFIENKGQWDGNILFKGTYNAGAVALKPDGGYRVLLNNRDDLQRIGQYVHAEPTTAAEKVSSSKLLPATAVAIKTPGGIVLHSHVYEASFLHANPHPVAVPEKKQDNYNNYFIGNDPAKWASKCNIYTAVTFKDVYPNIDVHYYTSGGHFKYDIVVNPGGDFSKVAIGIAGADSLQIKNGELVVKTSVDDVKELAPYSYSATAAGNKQLQCKFNLNGNVLTFKFSGPIPPGTPLVIDPTLVFCSFSGSSMDNWGYTATYDGAGNFYAGGIVFGQGFPTTTGAYQTFWAGGNNGTGEGQQNTDVNGFDMGIMKFNSTGTTAMYATYIGGKGGNEQPHSLVADGSGNLIIAGRTTAGDYPTLAPGTIGKGGGQDIVLSKLSADGSSLIGSLRIGGTGDDGVNIRSKDLTPYGTESIRRNYGDDARSEVILDKAGNICLASSTQSTDFPLVNASFSTLGGSQDAVLLKFTPALNSAPLVSTYLGGQGNDAAFVLAQDPLTLNLYVGGATSSSNFPGTSGVAGSPMSGTFLGGACDGFIAEFTNDGRKLIQSVYFGTSSADQIYGIDFNQTGNPFVMGTTEGVVPINNSPFNANGNQAQGKQFITKLKPGLAGIVYSANFGPANVSFPNISPTAFLVDICENVYVSGWGGGLDSYSRNGNGYSNSGPTGLTSLLTGPLIPQLSANPIAITTRNGTNVACFYFFVLEKNANSQLYGAFLGNPSDYDGMHVDGGTSRFDKSGVIYQAVCACGPDDATATQGAAYGHSGAYNSLTPGFGCNLASLKIAFNFSGVRAAVKSSINGVSNDTAGCVPLTIVFNDTIGNAQKYIWNFGDGSGSVTTTNPTTPHVYDKVGTYRIMLVAIDSSTCNVSDTSYLTVRVRNDPATLSFNYAKLLPCDSFNYVFNNKSIPTVGKTFTDSSFTWSFGDGSTVKAGLGTTVHHFAAAGTYTVKLNLVDTNFCNAPQSDSMVLRIASVVKAAFTTPAQGCVPYTAQFTNTSSAGQQFYWSFGDGGTSTQTTPSHIYAAPGVYVVQLKAVDSATCNIADSTTTTVTVYSLPVAAFNYSPQQAQENTPVTLTNLSTGATHYQWNFGDGTSLTTTSDTTVSHIYNKTGTYNVCLTAFNDAGCDSTICHAVQALIVPVVNVPNALAPGGGGANTSVHVHGFGIEKMDWKIYNRWGTLVFESTNMATGWDGRYKGVMQPQEVYVYVLDVQFSDGTKYQKKGDITLLR